MSDFSIKDVLYLSSEYCSEKTINHHIRVCKFSLLLFNSLKDPYSLTEDEKITPFDEVKDSINSLLQYSKEKETYTNKIKEWKKELKVKVYENRL